MAPKQTAIQDQEPIVIADAPPSEVEMLRLQVATLTRQMEGLMSKMLDRPAMPAVAPVSASAQAGADAAAQLPVDAAPWSIRVRATRMGFYPSQTADGKRSVQHFRRLPANIDTGFTGDEFLIEKAEEFAGGPLGWMQLVSEKPQMHKHLPPTSIPNQVQDPLGVLTGQPQRRIES